MLIFIKTIIRIYQLVFSPFIHALFGSGCRFEPSCSNYCLKALEIHGIQVGLKLSLKRFLKCHPFSKGGIDMVPSSLKKTLNSIDNSRD